MVCALPRQFQFVERVRVADNNHVQVKKSIDKLNRSKMLVKEFGKG
jgi:hypothetical protein